MTMKGNEMTTLEAAESLLFFVESFKGKGEVLTAHEVYRRIEGALPLYQGAIDRARETAPENWRARLKETP